MAFGKEQRSDPFAKTQDDIVRSRMPSRPKYVSEEVTAPGVQEIYEMGETELTEFFKMIMKSRPLINEVDLVLGSYKYTEQASRVPGVSNLGNLTSEQVAEVFTGVLFSDKKAIGFHAKVEPGKEGESVSSVAVYIADKEPAAPTMYDEDDAPLDGDAEFGPKMVIRYSPVR